MKYRVALEESEEGFYVWVPGLPGCVSQGTTEEEALANIADAVREYMEVAAEEYGRHDDPGDRGRRIGRAEDSRCQPCPGRAGA